MGETTEVPVRVKPPLDHALSGFGLSEVHCPAIMKVETPEHALDYASAMVERIENRDLAALGLVMLAGFQAVVKATEESKHGLLRIVESQIAKGSLEAKSHE